MFRKVKIKMITDSASDIPFEMAEEWEVDVMPIPITVDGKACFERVDFAFESFYDILVNAASIPSTSHITAVAFSEKFREYYEQGYTDLIFVSINSKGSEMYNAAIMGRQMLYEEVPEAENACRIHVVDSKTYTIAYGAAVLRAAQMVKKGAGVQDILDYLEDYFDSVEIYFSVYSLDFAKKSGRISVAAAFVGEMLGLRPVMSIIDGEIKIPEKVRGDKNVIPALVRYAKKQALPDSPYAVVQGVTKEEGAMLEKELTKEFGFAPYGRFQAGAAITINSGPKVVAVCVTGRNRKRG